MIVFTFSQATTNMMAGGQVQQNTVRQQGHLDPRTASMQVIHCYFPHFVAPLFGCEPLYFTESRSQNDRTYL